MNGADHYALLGVAVSAPLAVIKAAHRAQMREHHPDAAHGSEAMAKALNEALRVLQDEKLRAAYDATLGLDAAAAGRLRPDRAPAAEGTGGGAAASAEAERQAQAARVRTAARAAAAEAIRRGRERDEARARRAAGARAAARWVARQDPMHPAGLDVFAVNDISLASMRWHNREYPPLHIRKSPRRRPAATRMLAWLLLLVVAVAACVPAALAARGSRAPAATAILLLLLLPVPALLGGWARAHGAAGPWPAVPQVLFLSYAGGIVVPALAGGPAASPAPLAWLGAYVLAIEAFRATADPRRRRSAKLLVLRQDRERTLWEFGPAAEARRTGDTLTGQLLARLDHLPGSRRIHPLAFPGDPGRQVGHGVICGGRLALVDSVHGPGGRYLRREGRLAGMLPGRGQVEIEDRLPQAVLAYRRLFPELQVRGWTVLHPDDGTAMLASNQASDRMPRLATAEAALGEVGDWLAGGEPNVVDHLALSRLVLGHGKGEPRPDRTPGAAGRGSGAG